MYVQMSFWHSPYNSSAERDRCEAEEKRREEQIEAELLAGAISKSLSARLTNVNWQLCAHEIKLENLPTSKCGDYEGELTAPGDLFLERIRNHVAVSKMSNDTRNLIKKVAETIADDRFLKRLQMHYACVEIFADDGTLICEFVTNRNKVRFLCINVKLDESKNAVESSVPAITTKKSPNRIWRFLRKA